MLSHNKNLKDTNWLTFCTERILIEYVGERESNIRMKKYVVCGERMTNIKR